jgi:hypothetical protein
MFTHPRPFSVHAVEKFLEIIYFGYTKRYNLRMDLPITHCGTGSKRGMYIVDASNA